MQRNFSFLENFLTSCEYRCFFGIAINSLGPCQDVFLFRRGWAQGETLAWAELENCSRKWSWHCFCTVGNWLKTLFFGMDQNLWLNWAEAQTGRWTSSILTWNTFGSNRVPKCPVFLMVRAKNFKIFLRCPARCLLLHPEINRLSPRKWLGICWFKPPSSKYVVRATKNMSVIFFSKIELLTCNHTHF